MSGVHRQQCSVAWDVVVKRRKKVTKMPKIKRPVKRAARKREVIR